MDLGLQALLSMIFAHLLQKMKDSPAFSFITPFTDGITKALAAVASVLTALAITATFVVDPDTGMGTLTLVGIPTSFEGWTTILLRAGLQYAGIKFYYLTAIKPHNAGVKVQGVGDTDDRNPRRRR